MRCNSGVTAAISHKAYHSEDIDMKIRMSILVAVLFLGYAYTPGIAAPQPPNNIFDLLGLVSMDELGNVYISNGQGVMAFDPSGTNILRIPTGSGATNNTFAGRNNKILFITGPVDKVTAVKMNVKGAANW